MGAGQLVWYSVGDETQPQTQSPYAPGLCSNCQRLMEDTMCEVNGTSQGADCGPWPLSRRMLLTICRVAFLRKCETLPINGRRITRVPLYSGVDIVRCYWCRVRLPIDKGHEQIGVCFSHCRYEVRDVLASACLLQTRGLFIAELPLAADVVGYILAIARDLLKPRAVFLEAAEALVVRAKKEGCVAS